MKAEDIPDDLLFDGYDSQIAQVARILARHRSNWMEILLAALSVGGTLCVHELPTEGDLYTMTVRGEAHVLGPDGCDAEMTRVQYGPRPAEVEITERRAAG